MQIKNGIMETRNLRSGGLGDEGDEFSEIP